MFSPRRLLGMILSTALLTLAVGVALATVVVPKLLGAAPYTVLTGSMRPVMSPGDLAIVRPVATADLRIGDVITYQLAPGEPAVVTHRIVGITAASDGGRSFITQGDANPTADDSPVISPQIRGKVAYHVPWMGHVNAAINTQTRNTAMVVGAGGLIAYGLWQLASEARANRQRRRAAAVS